MSFTFMTQFMLLYVILMYTGQVFLGLAVHLTQKQGIWTWRLCGV